LKLQTLYNDIAVPSFILSGAPNFHHSGTKLGTGVRHEDVDRYCRATQKRHCRRRPLGCRGGIKHQNLPTVVTISAADGPNGPVLPVISQTWPDAPVIHRPGEINAWENKDFGA
jgi:hypothetical protein